jgi:hypothetical protein
VAFELVLGSLVSRATVEIRGDGNLNELQQVLVESVRGNLGFGLLLRACDVIAAFLFLESEESESG